jgi:arginyl-tRNA synthetase
MEETLKKLISGALEEVYGVNAPFVLEHPKDLSHGDYATNAALVVSKSIGKNPADVAKALAQHIEANKGDILETVSIAGPGFINLTLTRKFFSLQLAEAQAPTFAHHSAWAGKRVMVEYTDPNPFKPFHIGHLMTNAIGEAIARLLEAAGASVIRANYQGDVGLHVAKAIYGLMQKGKPSADLSASKQAQYIGVCYAEAFETYENDADAKAQMDAINKKVYERSDEAINELYDWGRAVTLEAFEEIYKTLGTKFDYYFFEGEMAEKGKALVEEFLSKGIFEESDGAIVFRAEKYNPKLHTRVFITGNRLPTYETKELGLTMTKFEKEKLDTSLVITASEQKDYMAVATEAMRHIQPEYAERMLHRTHGMMRFAEGKMSSRKGNVITGESLLNEAQELAMEKMAERDMDQSARTIAAEKIGVAAIKYTILRQAVGGDIIYNPEQSLSFEGDSGPYLQYTATRAASVIAKAAAAGIKPSVAEAPETAYEIERVLYRFPEVVARAGEELEPHHVATYLIDLASRFNSFYANEVIADPKDQFAPYKLALTTAVHTCLVKGLYLLGISVPERM